MAHRQVKVVKASSYDIRLPTPKEYTQVVRLKRRSLLGKVKIAPRHWLNLYGMLHKKRVTRWQAAHAATRLTWLLFKKHNANT